MSRTSRLLYHQNVYDLLDLTGDEASPQSLWLIEAFEDRHGPLPAAVREWYLIPNAVPLNRGHLVEDWDVKRGTIWFEYSDIDNPVPLERVLAEFTRVRAESGPAPGWRAHIPRQFVCVMSAHQGVADWFLPDDVSDDPPVWQDCDGTEWKEVAPRFSDFLFEWLAFHYASDFYRSRTPHSRHHPYHDEDNFRLPHGPPFEKPYASGLWLRTSDEPFNPPVIDYLTEQLDEPERASRVGNVTTYTFRPPDGIIRVTADEPGLSGGLSAWWIHAETPNRLAELARLVLPFGTLRETLRADTDSAREMLRAITS